ncbi:MAG: hypothetical protein C5B52_01030 [Bacteroidetes bacterium]|nr:MAG: hypothetical protein C5B52_01030 [Bacteroidota bacterium]
MFKRLIALILTVAFTVQCFSQSLTVIDFYLNQKYISKVLCENRAKPSTCCQGKCFLKKQMKQGESNNQQSTGARLENKTETFNIHEASTIQIVQFTSIDPNFTLAIHREVYSGFPNSVFHPPCGF